MHRYNRGIRSFRTPSTKYFCEWTLRNGKYDWECQNLGRVPHIHNGGQDIEMIGSLEDSYVFNMEIYQYILTHLLM